MYHYILIIINFFKFKIKKVFSKSNLNINNVQKIYLRTKIKVLAGGTLNLGRNTWMCEYASVFVGNEGTLKIDDNVYFNKGIFISCQNKVTIEKNCLFGPDVKIVDNNHRFTRENGVSQISDNVGEIYIGENTWIASNTVILKNSKIGKNCVIGAGCIINQEIPDYSIVTQDSNNIVIKEIEAR